MPKTKTKRKISNLFDAAGNIRQEILSRQNRLEKTEKFFNEEAERIKISQRGTKKDLKTKSVNFKEIFQQLTIVNLLEFFFSPFWCIFKKIKVSRGEDVNLKVEDPFTAPPPKSKGLASFLILSSFFILSFSFFVYFQKISSLKIKITNRSQQAVLALKQGQEAVAVLNLSGAFTSFNQAENNFQEILNDFNQFGFLTKSFLNLNPKSKKTLEVSLALVEVGKNLAAVGEILAQSSQAVIAENSLNWGETLVFKLAAINSVLNLTLPKVAEAKVQLKEIDFNLIPPDFREKLEVARQSLPQIETGLTNVSQLLQALLQVLGYEQWQRYLLIFQNNNELRATGGFMGSFALLDVDRGQIKNLEIPAGGSYDLQGSLQAMVASPEPLHLINPVWEFQDANWWPNFPTTAKKIAWFYEQAGGPSVDGVIAFTPVVMEKLLEIVGPVAMVKYNRTITAENFVEETQKIVELEYKSYPSYNAYSLSRPKQFLADLAPEILKRLFNLDPADLPKVWSVLAECLKEKHLLVYSFQPETQEILAALNWSGEFRVPADADFLAVINTNIGGGKTDGVISQIINHQAEITAPGKIIDTVTITRVHGGEPGNIFTGVQNNSYLRVYVPLGSKLLSVSGFTKPSADLFEKPPAAYGLDKDLLNIETQHLIDETSGTEIYTEFSSDPIGRAKAGGFTVFANWLLIKAGEQKTVVLKYELPFTFPLGRSAGITNDVPMVSGAENGKLYKLFVQKQAGTIADRFSSKIVNQSGLKVASTNANGDFQTVLEGARENLQFIDKLTTDKYFEVIFE